MNPIQAVEEFEARHGGATVAVVSSSGAWVLYPDGARREVNPYGLLDDGPWNKEMHPYNGNQDRLDLDVLDRQINYWNVKANSLVRKHERLRGSMMGTDYSDEQLKELEQVADAVKDAQEQLDALKDERAENPVVKEHEARKAALAEQQERIEQKTAALKRMKV